VIVEAEGTKPLPLAGKGEVAHRILDQLVPRLTP